MAKKLNITNELINVKRLHFKLKILYAPRYIKPKILIINFCQLCLKYF